jgi:DNA-binding NtrC family response regulator
MLPSRPAVRILIAIESTQAAELAEPALNNSAYATRRAVTPADAATALTDWRPHMVLLHMDENGGHIMQLVACCPARLPVIGLTQHGDLKTKLAAFEAGSMTS